MRWGCNRRGNAMFRIVATLTAIGALAIGAFTLGTGSASAAVGGNGPHGQTIAADCGSDGMIDVIINSQAGQFAGAHVVGGGTFVPTAFGETTIKFTPPGGTAITNTDPAVTKGSSTNSAGA